MWQVGAVVRSDEPGHGRVLRFESVTRWELSVISQCTHVPCTQILLARVSQANHQPEAIAHVCCCRFALLLCLLLTSTAAPAAAATAVTTASLALAHHSLPG